MVERHGGDLLRPSLYCYIQPLPLSLRLVAVATVPSSAGKRRLLHMRRPSPYACSLLAAPLTTRGCYAVPAAAPYNNGMPERVGLCLFIWNAISAAAPDTTRAALVGVDAAFEHTLAAPLFA